MMNKSASTTAAPISVAPSISRVVIGVVPAVNTAPEPVKLVAVNTPVELSDAVSAAAALAARAALHQLQQPAAAVSVIASPPAAVRAAGVAAAAVTTAVVAAVAAVDVAPAASRQPRP